MKTLLSSQLLEAIFRMVEVMPQNSVANVVAVLEADASLSALLRGRVLASMALPEERRLCIALLDVWKKEANPPLPLLVATALRSALYTRAAMANQEQIELVWTGPSAGTTLRRIDQALYQVIQSAQHELLLVTFAAYRVPLLMDALRIAIARGVLIRFVAESTEESEGKVTSDPRKAFGDLAERLTIYIWPRERRITDANGSFGALHAKCALADEGLLLVSSANLTGHALLLNMEMGLLVRGGSLPTQVRDHFNRLVALSELVIA